MPYQKFSEYLPKKSLEHHSDMHLHKNSHKNNGKQFEAGVVFADLLLNCHFSNENIIQKVCSVSLNLKP